MSKSFRSCVSAIFPSSALTSLVMNVIRSSLAAQFAQDRSAGLTMCRATLKPPLLKLFEFLSASLCLFLIEDDEPVPTRAHGAYAFASPVATNSNSNPTSASHSSPAHGKSGNKVSRSCREVGKASWWTVDLPEPPAELLGTRAHMQAYDLLCVCLTLHIPQARAHLPLLEGPHLP